MSKASRLKQQSAREKIAAQRAAAARARKRRITLTAVGSVVVVAAVVLAFVIVLTNSNSGKNSSGTTMTASQTVPVLNKIASVPPSTAAAVGKGTTYPNILVPLKGTPPPLTSGGKPEVLYMGAEYCPYCATERWAIVTALSRFGTFHNVAAIHSSATDTPASIPTLTFYKSNYTSNYVNFTPVETQTVDRKPLMTPTPAQTALINKYDAPPYVAGATPGQGPIPFMDFGNKWILSGASYNYTVLQGKTWTQIASALHDPSSAIAKGAVGTANQMTAAICKMTNNQPGNVCGTSVIKNLEGQV